MTTTIDSQTTGAPTRIPDGEGGASLEKVRDLLFGVQMRDYDRRFGRLEERLLKETSDLREEVKKRLSAVEQLLRQEIDSLTDRLRGDQEERVAADKDLARELHETTTALQKKTGQLDEQLARGLREVRQQLHEQRQQLTDELQAQADAVLARLGRETQELRSDKADRAALASLLTEMAMRLNDEFRLPTAEEAARG